MDKLLKEIEDFSSERDWHQFHTPENIAKSIVIEANELLEHYQFSAEGDGDTQGIEDEIADVLNYTLMMCSRLNLDPMEIVRKKMKKNAEKYPVEKARGSAKKYNEL